MKLKLVNTASFENEPYDYYFYQDPYNLFLNLGIELNVAFFDGCKAIQDQTVMKILN
ncbi:MAG: hypothetical protein IPM51_04280 [Sphingobacteriaceae bacterium]|nr:hypothetical protein [Sphingobacteriaceae bacterium]